MNKLCPYCKKPVTKKQPHVFHDGKRCHEKCFNDAVVKASALGKIGGWIGRSGGDFSMTSYTDD